MACMQAWFSAVKSSAVHNTRQYLKTQQKLQMKKQRHWEGGTRQGSKETSLTTA